MMKNTEISKEAKAAENEAKTEKLYTKAELDQVIGKEREAFEKKLIEAEKLSRMDEQQKAKYQQEKLEKKLAERERAVAKRELMADANDMLENAGLPKRLAFCLNYADRESCEKSVAAIKEVFGEAVKEAIESRIRGNSPKLSPESGRDAFLDGLGA